MKHIKTFEKHSQNEENNDVDRSPDFSKEFKDINKMVEKFNESNISKKIDLHKLDIIQFFALIYSLDTGRFEISGVGESSYLRYFMTSGEDEKFNWAMDITNNLPYTLDDFIKVNTKWNLDHKK